MKMASLVSLEYDSTIEGILFVCYLATVASKTVASSKNGFT